MSLSYIMSRHRVTRLFSKAGVEPRQELAGRRRCSSRRCRRSRLRRDHHKVSPVHRGSKEPDPGREGHRQRRTLEERQIRRSQVEQDGSELLEANC